MSRRVPLCRRVPLASTCVANESGAYLAVFLVLGSLGARSIRLSGPGLELEEILDADFPCFPNSGCCVGDGPRVGALSHRLRLDEDATELAFLEVTLILDGLE